MKTSTKLKIAGLIMLAVGITLIILGTVVYKSEVSHDFFVPNFALLIPGIFLCFLTLPVFFISFAPSFASMGAKLQKESLDRAGKDFQTVATQSAQIQSESLTVAARAIKDGLNPQTAFCKQCGIPIDADSKFCKQCGAVQERVF